MTSLAQKEAGACKNVTVIHRYLRNMNPSQKVSSIVHGLSRQEAVISFKCNLPVTDSFLEETYDGDKVDILRFRHLTNPPPVLPLTEYEHVRIVHVSCVVPIGWLFFTFSSFMNLKAVHIGSGCFEDEEMTHQFNRKLEPYSSVKEFTLMLNASDYARMEKRQVQHRVAMVFNCAKICFTDLKAVDLTLPLDFFTYLDEFRHTLLQFAGIGEEHKNFTKNELTYKARVPGPRSDYIAPERLVKKENPNRRKKREHSGDVDCITISDEDEPMSHSLELASQSQENSFTEKPDAVCLPAAELVHPAVTDPRLRGPPRCRDREVREHKPRSSARPLSKQSRGPSGSAGRPSSPSVPN